MQMEGLQPYIWTGLPGNVYTMRGSPYHRIMWVAEGSITVRLPDNGQLITLKKGDRLDLPPGLPHQAVVGVEGAICVEAHHRTAAQQVAV